MIEIKSLSFGFPQKDLFEHISLTIESGQHIAFIGTSGNGKTTLAEMMMDREKYMFDGHIEVDPSCRMGHVSQFYKKPTADTHTVYEFLCEPFLKLQGEIDALCAQMETAEDIEPILEQYQTALDAFDAIGGHDYETDILKKLNLANLGKIKDLGVEKISGGEFKLVQVIKEMIQSPHLLIMDEPDVFLDFENLNSLKDLINAHKGTLLVITHNRYLLNNCFDTIMHLENKDIQMFAGNFIEYKFELLQKKIEQQELSIKDDIEIAKNEVRIDRLRTIATFNTDASRGKALKARVKVQERLEARRIKAPFLDIRQPNIRFELADAPVETPLVEAKDVTLRFEHDLIKQASFEINAGEKVALIGANGTGKTTLFKEIYQSYRHLVADNKPVRNIGYTGQTDGLSNHSGTITFAEGLEVDYLSQNVNDSAYQDMTIQDAFFELGYPSPDAIRSHLTRFGFDGDILKQKLSKISGGEKNLIQLAMLTGQKSHLLLLDEPTSHLDTYAQIALEQAIEAYKGAVLMISHDYYMIANCMDYVLIIEDHAVRKMSIRKFRKMIYENHFTHTYLELEEKKKALEVQIEAALSQQDFESAKEYAATLEMVIEQMLA